LFPSSSSAPTSSESSSSAFSASDHAAHRSPRVVSLASPRYSLPSPNLALVASSNASKYPHGDSNRRFADTRSIDAHLARSIGGPRPLRHRRAPPSTPPRPEPEARARAADDDVPAVSLARATVARAPAPTTTTIDTNPAVHRARRLDVVARASVLIEREKSINQINQSITASHARIDRPNASREDDLDDETTASRVTVAALEERSTLEGLSSDARDGAHPIVSRASSHDRTLVRVPSVFTTRHG
jgi:hypothetical protein